MGPIGLIGPIHLIAKVLHYAHRLGRLGVSPTTTKLEAQN